MARTTTKRRRNSRRTHSIVPASQLAIVPAPEKPVRGVKLKTVSRFAMVFALLCLGAFLAGRVDVAAMNEPTAVTKGHALVPKSVRGHKRTAANQVRTGTSRQRVEQTSF